MKGQSGVMYESFFGLKENPFNLTPDPRYLFLSTQHREALNHLLYGVKERKGFIVMTGGIGTGKTTLCRAFIAALDAAVDSALVFNAGVSDTELLKTIVQEFDIKMGKGRKTKKNYVDALNQFLLKGFSEGRNAVVLIDEAQNLSRGVLEQLRMLSNLETDREKLLQIVLLGQPELQEALQSPSLRQLNERITVRYELAPLDQIQVREYIEHRIAVAGDGNAKVTFVPGAYKLVFGYSRGIPRRINAICDRALLIAYTKDSPVVTAGIVWRATHDIGGGYLRGFPGFQGDRAILMMVALILSACTIFLIALVLWQNSL